MDTSIYIVCLRQVVAFAPKVIKCAAYGDAIMNGRRNGIRWLSRFKLILRRRISLATLPRGGVRV